MEIKTYLSSKNYFLCWGAAKTPANEGKCDNGNISSAKVFKVFPAPLSRLIKLRDTLKGLKSHLL